MAFPAPVRLGCLLLGAALGLGACSTTGDSISKVKILRLDPTQRIVAGDPSIDFERRHYLHGALTAEEAADRRGNYYTAFWTVSDRTQPVTLRFEYRSVKTGSKVQVIEQTIDAPKRSNVTEFQITGPTLAHAGRVLAWRLMLVRDKQVLATRESYLWN